MNLSLEKLWEEHLHCEFELKDADATMATMGENPFVNHIPTMAGGYGYKNVYHFYKTHFIPKIPADINVSSISRTVGKDRLVDELILYCTHDREIDFMLPGIAPTHKFIELPHVVVVYFKDNKVIGEHIYWDQATLLVQIGLLDPKQYPVTDAEQAQKTLNEQLPNNKMMDTWLKKMR